MAQQDEFARQAETRQRGMFGELWAFMRTNKKWWLIPVIVTLALVGILVILSATSAAPFIYTLF